MFVPNTHAHPYCYTYVDVHPDAHNDTDPYGHGDAYPYNDSNHLLCGGV